MSTARRLAEIGYGLDLDGDSFETCPVEPLEGTLTFDGSPRRILELFPWVEECARLGEGEDLAYFFKPDEVLSEEPHWEAWLMRPHFYVYRLLGHGHIRGEDRDCVCGENPNCLRCEGTGSVKAPAGWWALFAWRSG